MSTDTDSYAYLYDMSDSDLESTEDDLLDVLLQCQQTLNKKIQKPKRKSKKRVKK